MPSTRRVVGEVLPVSFDLELRDDYCMVCCDPHGHEIVGENVLQGSSDELSIPRRHPFHDHVLQTQPISQSRTKIGTLLKSMTSVGLCSGYLEEMTEVQNCDKGVLIIWWQETKGKSCNWVRRCHCTNCTLRIRTDEDGSPGSDQSPLSECQEGRLGRSRWYPHPDPLAEATAAFESSRSSDRESSGGGDIACCPPGAAAYRYVSILIYWSRGLGSPKEPCSHQRSSTLDAAGQCEDGARTSRRRL